MIRKPTLLLDKEKAISNLERMVAKAQRNQCVLRPHFKTHQSHQVGAWFRDMGVESITVSSVSMAEYFAKDGWKDITIAFPVNLAEIEEINALASSVQLNLLVESMESAEFLSEHLNHSAGIFIKIDLGTHRTGIDPDDLGFLEKLSNKIDQSGNMKFMGFLGHSGHSYGARAASEISKVHERSREIMSDLKDHFLGSYPDLFISVGDTPTCSVVEDFTWADEMRPGNFIFYDLMQHQIGSCREQDIAVGVACPVVALHPERNEIVIYGGGVHFSKDFILNPDGSRNYGGMVQSIETGWGALHPEVYLKKLSQEHGILHAPDDFFTEVKPGDVLIILPVHSCMTANLLKTYQTFDHEVIRMMDAPGSV